MSEHAPPPGFEVLEESGPFTDGIGPIYGRESGEVSVVGLRSGERHANAAGAVHGGLLATLCDTAVGHAIRRHADGLSAAATVSLTTDYLAPAQPGAWLAAHTEVEKLGSRLAVADC